MIARAKGIELSTSTVLKKKGFEQKVQQKHDVDWLQRFRTALPLGLLILMLYDCFVGYVLRNCRSRFIAESTNFTPSDWPKRLRPSVTRASRPIRMRLAIPIKGLGDCTLKESSNKGLALATGLLSF